MASRPQPAWPTPLSQRCGKGRSAATEQGRDKCRASAQRPQKEEKVAVMAVTLVPEDQALVDGFGHQPYPAPE
jgi:hypothetical protein